MTIGFIILLSAFFFVPVGVGIAAIFTGPKLKERDVMIDKLLKELTHEQDERTKLAKYAMDQEKIVKRCRLQWQTGRFILGPDKLRDKEWAEAYLGSSLESIITKVGRSLVRECGILMIDPRPDGGCEFTLTIPTFPDYVNESTFSYNEGPKISGKNIFDTVGVRDTIWPYLRRDAHPSSDKRTVRK